MIFSKLVHFAYDTYVQKEMIHTCCFSATLNVEDKNEITYLTRQLEESSLKITLTGSPGVWMKLHFVENFGSISQELDICDEYVLCESFFNLFIFI